MKKIAVFLILFVVVCVFRFTDAAGEVDRWFYAQASVFARSGLWLKAWEGITFFGYGALVDTFFGLCGLMVFTRAVDKRRLVLFLVFMILLLHSNILLKMLFAFDRPPGLSLSYPPPITPSFPSGHAVNGVILFYFLPRWLKACGSYSVRISGWFAAIGIIVIAASRVFLGVHWLSDVVAGVLWGLVISDVGLKAYGKTLQSSPL